MAIRVFCDICGKEAKEQNFTFEATKQEIIIDLITDQKRLDKKLIQICKGCFNEHIAKLLIYGKKENGNKKTTGKKN